MAMRAEFADLIATEAREIQPPVYKDYVLDDLLAWRREGLQTALVTLTGIEGSSPRPLGSQLAVASNGRAVGAVTGGCAERAIILDALGAMARGRNHMELYGKGSRFKDIVLPCGSGVHMTFDVTLSDETLEALVSARKARRLSIYACEGPVGVFERIYRPRNQLVMFGRGSIVPFLAQFGAMSEYQVHVFCPDETMRLQCMPFADVHPLLSPKAWDNRLIDAHTAVVSLFHDHDYEAEILPVVLESEAFYIGALGSRRTHTKRLNSLAQTGCPPDVCKRIDGPTGIDIGAKTPPEIALSVMAKIVSTARCMF